MNSKMNVFGGKYGGISGMNPNFFLVKNGLPTDGLVGFLQNSDGQYLGRYNTKGATLDMVAEAKGWERWIFSQRQNGAFVIKQECSGFYVGGTKGNGESPKLAEKEDAWERMVIESKGNNCVAIKNIDGNYLSTNQQKKSVWTNAPDEHALWRILPVPDQPKNTITLQYFEGLPSIGDHVTLVNSNGGYIGGTKDAGHDIGIADVANEWEDMVFEIVGDKISLKNSVSNNYIGKVCEKGQTLQWTPKRDAWEFFTIQNIGNGVVALKNIKGYYLSNNHKKLVLTDKATQSEQWKFMPSYKLLKMGITSLSQHSLPTQGGNQGFNQGGFNQGGFGQQGNQGGFGQQTVNHGHGHGHGHGH
jgi:hypothetical protein